MPRRLPVVRVMLCVLPLALLAALGSLTDANPSEGLQALRDASADVHKVGQEAVAGQQATHYRATIDLERAASNADGARAKSLRTLSELTGTKTIPIDVWVDGANLVRRFRERIR